MSEATADEDKPRTSSSHQVKRFLANNGALVGLVVICIALFIATPNFLTAGNLLNVGIQAAVIAILAFGMTFVIVTAGIDLAVGSMAALGAMAAAFMFVEAGLPGWLALIVGLLVGALAGAASGFAVAYAKLPPSSPPSPCSALPGASPW